MNGDVVDRYVTYPSAPAEWTLVGFGDFNADGRTDVFWYNFYSGETSSWLLKGDTVERDVR